MGVRACPSKGVLHGAAKLDGWDTVSRSQMRTADSKLCHAKFVFVFADLALFSIPLLWSH